LIQPWLAAQLTALTIASIPRPEDVPTITPASTAPRSAVTTLLDSTTGSLATAARRLGSLLAPVRAAIIYRYLGVLGLAQPWKMFANVATANQYMVLRFLVAGAGTGAGRSETVLVFPAIRDDQVRLVRGYLDSGFDKAILNATRDFSEHIAERPRPPNQGDALPTDLVPLTRYYAKRFRKSRLIPPERLAGVEVWWGTAPIPPPGERASPAIRLAALRRYYDAPVEGAWTNTEGPSVQAVLHEADITWVRLYAERW